MMSSGVLDNFSTLCARALLDSLWLGVACMLAGSIVLRVARVSAATRYTTWCLLLITILCLPLATLTGAFFHTSIAAAAQVGSTTTSTTAGTDASGGAGFVVRPKVAHSMFTLWDVREAINLQPPRQLLPPAIVRSFTNVIVLVWALVAIVCLMRLATRLARLDRVKKMATYVGSPIALPRNARLLCLDGSGVPSALGYFRPAILVSPNFFHELAEFDLHQILMHEAAHLRRRDDWTTLFYQAVRCLLWFNPAVYVIGRAMSLEREVACDDVVVAASGKPRRYAQTIWIIAQTMLTPSLPLSSGIFKTRSHALVRLERLLRPRPLEHARFARSVPSGVALLGCSALALATCLAPASALPAPAPIASVAPMGDLRADHTATLLPNGEILIAGGLSGNNPDTALKTTELYDPRRHAFTPTGNMLVARGGATAILLRDGKVLIAGGWTPTGITTETELYDIATGTFSRAASMHTARADHTATMLSDGRVLLSGGAVGDVSATASAEIYDSNTGSFTPTGSMHAPRSEHAATLLSDGRVLVVGGDSDGATLASAETFDPKTHNFSQAGAMSSPRTKLAAVRLRDGKVLVMGGQMGVPSGARESTSELFDPTNSTFERSGSMHDARYKITDAAVLLLNGDVLVAGGSDRAEVYNEAKDAFTLVPGSLGIARHFATVTALKDGTVLIAGGYSMPHPQTTNSAVVLTL